MIACGLLSHCVQLSLQHVALSWAQCMLSLFELAMAYEHARVSAGYDDCIAHSIARAILRHCAAIVGLVSVALSERWQLSADCCMDNLMGGQ